MNSISNSSKYYIKPQLD